MLLHVFCFTLIAQHNSCRGVVAEKGAQGKFSKIFLTAEKL